MIEYWHWHTNHFGTETYWIGILPHDQQPGRVYAELSRLGADFRHGRFSGCRAAAGRHRSACCIRLGPSGGWRSRPASRSPGRPASDRSQDIDQRSYHRIFEAFYRGTFDAGVPARLIHDVQIIGPDGSRLLEPAAVAAELPVLVVAGLLVADDDLLTWLRDYAAAGGHLVIGPRTAYGDEEGRARLEVKPAHLAEAGGVRYQEFSNLSEPLTVVAETDAIALSEEAAATDWIDGLISEGAKVIVGYDHPHFGRFPTVVSNEHGQGRITTVGTVPNPALAADLVRWLASRTGSEVGRASRIGDRPLGNQSRLVSGSTSFTTGAGLPHSVTLPRAMTDILAEADGTTNDLELGPWDVRVLAE